MRTTPCTITAIDVQVCVELLIPKYLRRRDHGPKCRAGRLWTSLLYAAARICSRATACAALATAPSDTAVHDALLAGLAAFAERQRRLNRALQGHLPKAVRRRRQPLAIDRTLISSHGQPLPNADEIYRSQAKSGTSHFHAYVVRTGLRFTVGLTAVRQGEALTEVIRRLLGQAAQAAVRPRYLLLDRGFGAVDVIRYLQAGRRAADHPKGPSGTQIFATWKKSGWGQYTMTNARRCKARFAVCVKCRHRHGERGRSLPVKHLGVRSEYAGMVSHKKGV